MTILITILIAIANYGHEQEKRAGLNSMAEKLGDKRIKNVDIFAEKEPKKWNNYWKKLERTVVPFLTIFVDVLIAFLISENVYITILVGVMALSFFAGFFDGILNLKRGKKFFVESYKDSKKIKDKTSILIFVISLVLLTIKII